MRYLKVNEENLRLAAAVLAGGGLVAFPTETVYGLGADAFNPAALSRVFEVKKRPRFDPLIVHIASLEALDTVADMEALDSENRGRLDCLAALFWPGPLTLVLPKQPRLPGLVSSGLPTVAVRFPSHPAALALIKASGCAAAAPSANPFGKLSPTRAEHVLSGLGEAVDVILDGGPCAVGVESTVISLCGKRPVLLREGGTARERLEEALKEALKMPPEDAPAGKNASPSLSPGQLPSHYAPSSPLILHTKDEITCIKPAADEVFLFFSGESRSIWEEKTEKPAKNRDMCWILSEKGDTKEAAAAFFEVLHKIDSLKPRCIHAETPPDTGLGRAINDRLRRAAAPRAASCTF